MCDEQKDLRAYRVTGYRKQCVSILVNAETEAEAERLASDVPEHDWDEDNGSYDEFEIENSEVEDYSASFDAINPPCRECEGRGVVVCPCCNGEGLEN